MYSLIAIAATSVVIAFLFYYLAASKMSMNPQIYTRIDIYAGTVYVFVLSMIVSASIWPGIIEKRFQ